VLAISDTGRTVVAAVRSQRRAEIAEVLKRMPTEPSPAVIEWLDQFTLAAGESAELSWTLGWTG
jgi:hypothetical protein